MARKGKSRAKIDEIMKYLFGVSKETLIKMLNSLFKQNFSVENAAIIQTNSEFVDDNFDITRGDLFFRVIDESKPHNFHIEIETRPNGNMTIRVLEYDIKKADENQRLNNKCGIKRYILPKSIVIHIEKGNNIPDCYEFEIVDVKPDGTEEIIHRVVPVIKYWELSHEDLVEQKLYPLLPMQIFLLRSELKKFAGEKDSENKRAVIEQIKKMTEKIIIEVFNLTEEGIINKDDDNKIVTALNKLIQYLNKQYNFDETLNQEVDIMMTSSYTTFRREYDKNKLKDERERQRLEENKLKLEIEKIEMVKEMLLDKEPLEKIMKYSKFTKTKIKHIEKELAAQN